MAIQFMSVKPNIDVSQVHSKQTFMANGSSLIKKNDLLFILLLSWPIYQK